MSGFMTPLAISGMGKSSQSCQRLESVVLSADPAGNAYNEAWLQNLIDRHPDILLLEEIEPAFEAAVSACREMSVRSGFIDNLLVTPDGGIVVVETKLWRNPEARRAVIAQILDYATDLSGLDYAALEEAIARARKQSTFNLFRHVCPKADPSREAKFVDAISRNLRLGRMMLLIVGDGIHEGVERLSDYLQRHVGLHFTLGLVEMSLWRNPNDGTVIVQPRVLAQTVQIERAVIRIDDSASTPAVRIQPTAEQTSRRTSLSFETFLEEQAVHDPDLKPVLAPFIEQAKSLGIVAEMKSNGLQFNWKSQDGRSFNLGTLHRDGFSTTGVGQGPKLIGRLDLADKYRRDLVRRLPGTHLVETPTGQNSWVAWHEDGTDWYLLSSWVLDPKTDVLAAMTKHIKALSRALEGSAAAAE